MKLEIPARFVDKAHRAVDTTLEATLTQDTVLVPIRMKFNQVVFELRVVNPDGVLVYHQAQR